MSKASAECSLFGATPRSTHSESTSDSLLVVLLSSSRRRCSKWNVCLNNCSRNASKLGGTQFLLIISLIHRSAMTPRGSPVLAEVSRSGSEVPSPSAGQQPREAKWNTAVISSGVITVDSGTQENSWHRHLENVSRQVMIGIRQQQCPKICRFGWEMTPNGG